MMISDELFSQDKVTYSSQILYLVAYYFCPVHG